MGQKEICVLSFFKYIRNLFFMMLAYFASEGNGASTQKPMRYSYFGRLWRIYKFIKRVRKKRRKAKKILQQQQKQKRRIEKDFKKRMRRRKLKVILKSFFKPRYLSEEEKEKIHEAERLRLWKRRKQKRIRKVFFKGFFKTKPISPSKKAYYEKIQREQDFNKYKRRRRLRFILKRNREILSDFLKGKGLPKRRKKSTPSVWKYIFKKDQLIISTHSLMLFLVSYFFIEFISNLSMGITSLLFDYKTVIYYYKIEFLVDYDAWYADSIKTIFAAGPVVAFIIAILSLIIYSMVYLETGVLKILLLWTILHGSNKIIGGTLIGNLLGKGFGYVIMYLYYSDTGKLIMSLLMIMASIVIGTISTKYWIMSANSYYKFSKPENRRVFINSQVLIPFLLGTPLLFLINQPEVLRYETLINVSLIFMILPPVLLNPFYQDYYFEDNEKKITWSYRIIIFAIAFIIAYRVLLGIGLRMG